MQIVGRIAAAITKAVAGFELTAKDTFVIVTDPGVVPDVRKALEQVAAACGYTLLVSDTPTGSAQAFTGPVADMLARGNAWLFVTSLSRTHCPQVVEHVIHNKRARLMSVTNGRPDIWLEGAINEDFDAMRERVRHIAEWCRGVKYFHITDKHGTNLVVFPWQEHLIKEPGLITKPGDICNFPFGETAWPVKLTGSSGDIVSQGVVGTGVGYPDKPIILRVKNGVVTSVEGGKSADKLRASMDAAGPQAYWLAEVAFGANAAAWRDGGTRLPPTSLEGEKAYSPTNTTMHIAHGANHVFGIPEDHLWCATCAHHTDHVLWGGLTVKAHSSASFFLIKNGVPIY